METKLCDNRTKLIEFPNNHPYEIGAYIDIFPFYHQPNDDLKYKDMHRKSRKLVRKHWRVLRSSLDYIDSANLLKRIIGYFLSFYAKTLYNNNYLKRLEKMWASYPKGEYIGFYWDNETGQRILQEVVGETIKKQFEDAVFWIPKNLSLIHI